MNFTVGDLIAMLSLKPQDAKVCFHVTHTDPMHHEENFQRDFSFDGFQLNDKGTVLSLKIVD